ncbi:MAG: 4Fe-4S dicluster domain-containing protein [Pseudomonadota bacterium]
MSLLNARRATQAFFLVLFAWLCAVSSPGPSFLQLGAWPVTWLLQLDPLVALETALARGAIEPGMLWALGVVALTLLFGRVFCGWICPLGTLNHAIGWLGQRGVGLAHRIAASRPHRGERAALVVLAVQLAAAAGSGLAAAGAWLRGNPLLGLVALGPAVVLLGLWAHRGERARQPARQVALLGLLALLGLASMRCAHGLLQSSLALGWLDPLPLLHRAAHTVVLPLADRSVALLWPFPRQHALAPWTALTLATVLLANLWRPRAFCRFACPLGALLGLIGRAAPWRIAKRTPACSDCGRCEAVCPAAAQPSGALRQSACVLCLRCTEACPEGLLSLAPRRSAAGEAPEPDLGRRATALGVAAGLAVVPVLRLGGAVSGHAAPGLIRPPGALPEADFLARCIACGQCMRVCPTNVLQPAGLLGGLEAAWTPVLDMRVGTSGCQPSCTACGEVCPTGAIRLISLDEKLGRGEHESAGPVRIGTAFVDRGRCLPWAMDRPCIVCQEVCPVSPKAVLTERVVQVLEDGREVALERPRVDPVACIGCGICEHECPVAGEAAIRVDAAGESRDPGHTLVLGS